MKYLLLIYGDESDWASMTEAEKGTVFNEYMAFGQRVKKGGNYIGGEALEPTASATTVQVRDGKTLTTDGPFVETREQLGGCYMIEAENLDQAIAIAADIPGARMGSVEVRPIMPTPEPD